MDRDEFRERVEEIQDLIAQGEREEALEALDDINWKKIHNVNALIKSAQLYQQLGENEDAMELLLIAHDRSPIGRMVVYHLANLCITMGNYNEAEQYYKDFVEIAPHDSLRFLLRYNLSRAKGASDDELITILEELKEAEFDDEWAYELAVLYNKTGRNDKCVELCDEIVLWFGEGAYVEKALELKMLYQPLDKDQENRYKALKLRKDGITEIRAEETGGSGEILHENISIPEVSLPADRFNTVNLQAEIKKNIEEIMQATAADEVNESMANIKVLVEDVPYLKGDETKSALAKHETQQEIDKALKNSFLGYLDEEYDGQISMSVPEQRKEDDQISGQMTIEGVMGDWNKTRRAAEAALEEANRAKLESVRAQALEEAHLIMDKLEDMNGPDFVGASKIIAEMNELLQSQIEKNNVEAQAEKPVAEEVEEAVAEASAEETPVEEPAAEEVTEAVAEAPAEETPVEEPAAEEVTEAVAEAPAEETPVEEPAAEEVAEAAAEAPAEEAPAEKTVAELSLSERVARILNGESDEEYDEDEYEDEKEEAEEEDDRKAPAASEPVVVAEVPDKVLSDSEREIFSYFIPVKGMEASICTALTGIKSRLMADGNTHTGHVVIVGEKGTGKTMMATNLIKTLQKDIHKPNNRVGKIDAKKLNTKDINVVMSKLKGGCLIIEEAGDLSRETVIALAILMEQDTADTLVILEGDEEGLSKVLRYSGEFAKQFTEKISIPVFSINELVNFARAYAKDMECVIDEVGSLALYNRINNIQKQNHVTTLDEVKEIMDEAIESAEPRGLGGLFSKLGSAKYDEEGYLILKEKDFED